MTDVVANGLSKSYGNLKAVDDVSFRITGGRVCALAGPNGAGKSTLIGMLLGLIRPQRGSASFDGSAYVDLARPVETVGAVIDSAGVHPDRTAQEHLRVLATAARLPFSRVEDVLDETDLADVAERAVRTFSLGMRQRLRLACAQLGRPSVLILDEPSNGLDPEGRRWLRDMLADFARRGGTVLVSTHDLAEAELLADEVIILSSGHVVAHGAIADLTTASCVEVTTSRAADLVAAASRLGYAATMTGEIVAITAVNPEVVGRLILEQGLIIREMRTRSRTLEDVFLAATTAEAAPTPPQPLDLGAVTAPTRM
jgi:ABC-2 type transport system ATP-binding protein